MDIPNDIPEEMKEAMVKAAAHNGTLEGYEDENGEFRVRGMFIVGDKKTLKQNYQ